ncbi:hypothetical protein JTB14_024614 [Gonioctena quinquepunctata]|nr:hypothetical protein JTB14_024614 [Gonioctena quinquepunctata]
MKTFEIVAGTYEEFLIGYHFSSDESRLIQSLASHDHSSSLRSLASSGRYLATGGADDRIIVYDFKFTKDHSHLVSASTDGVLSIVRVGNWKLEKIWDKAHKGASILDVALHPSGKLALTLGTDSTLRTWNLVKGRQAYAINLITKSKDAKSLEKILWAVDGVRFLLYGGKYTEIWSIELGGILKVIEHPAKVTSCLWYSNKKILVGYEDGQVTLIHIDSLKKNIKKAHETRVKAMSRYLDWLVTASSNGEIKVWNKNLDELAKCNSGCRITCLAIVPLIEVKKEVKEDVEEEDRQETFKINRKRTVVIEDEGNELDSEGDSGVVELKTENIKKPAKNINGSTVQRVVVENSQPKKLKKKKHNKRKPIGDNIEQEFVKKSKKKKAF